MLEAIRTAHREILLETYIWSDDTTGHLFIEAVVDRARAGVHVRVIIDGFGSRGLSGATRRRLIDGGVQLAVFHPVRPWRRRWAWSVRDHRKVLVVDGAVGFAGGLNIGDDYAPPEWGGGGWHDCHVRVRGPAVDDLRAHFFEAWRHARGYRASSSQAARRSASGAAGADCVVVLGIGPLRHRRSIRRHYHYAIRQACRRVRIMAGYFIPDRGWRRLLRDAVRRGVDVAIMFPHSSDVDAVQWASRATYAALLRAGVRVLEWKPSVLHAKALSVDGAWSAVGSYNLDRRSLFLNWETSVLVCGAATALAIEARFEADAGQCVAIESAAWARRGLWYRILEAFYYAWRRWL